MQPFHRDYLVRLPLPLAQLYSRAHNATDPRGRHDNTFYLFEALIKLSAAPAIAEYLEEVERGEPRTAAIDKLLLQLALPSLGQWLGMLRELAPNKLLLSARLRPDWCPEDVEVIVDEPPSRGPLSGIAAALTRLQTSHLLALAIDMPQMAVAHAQKLWSLAGARRGVVPVNENRFEPLCAIYPAEASEAAHRALTQGQLSLQTFARALTEGNLIKRYQIQDSEKHLYFNFNEPMD